MDHTLYKDDYDYRLPVKYGHDVKYGALLEKENSRYI